MNDDLYSVLGVSKEASEGAIRKAYRKLAKDLHPDLNPGDAGAEERFKKVSAAYRLLNDPGQRARYDRGEIDASGMERPKQPFDRQYAESDGGGPSYTSSSFRDFEDVSDLFSDLFGGRGGPRHTVRAQGRDLHYHLEVDFLDAAKGAKRRITLPDGQLLNLTIPSGTKDGGVLRLKGKGGTGHGGGAAGNALVQISVRPHSVFGRNGNDIFLEIPITLDEAVLGGKVDVPTIFGPVSMTVPKGSSSGDVLRLRRKGVKSKSGSAGDQLVTLKIVMPDKIDEELSKFLESWRKTHRYDPRAKLR